MSGELPDLSGAVVANDGDTIIFTVPGVPTPTQLARMYEQFRAHLPEVRVLFVNATGSVVYKPNAVEVVGDVIAYDTADGRRYHPADVTVVRRTEPRQ